MNLRSASHSNLVPISELAAWLLRRRGLDRWIGPCLAETASRRPVRRGEPVHLLLCMADHFEPFWGDVGADAARARVARWVEDYPERFGTFRDDDGLPPRHTFFYPVERYHRGLLDDLSGLCRAGFGEVEVHLHHEDDTAEGLRSTLSASTGLLARRHGLLSRDRRTGELAYGFVHGDWALGNSHPDGCYCGVDEELDVLRETGCYADFTMPSAPDATQPSKINSIYYARGHDRQPLCHLSGTDVGTGPMPERALMMIQGPLLLDWGRRKWGVLPRIENGCVQETQPPTDKRLALWLKARIQVPSRPDWYFVKLSAHGASEEGIRTLLGDPMVRFHRALALRAEEDPGFHFHYVTAREMYNLVRAAEAGWEGTVAEARNYLLHWNGENPGHSAGRAGRFR